MAFMRGKIVEITNICMTDSVFFFFYDCQYRLPEEMLTTDSGIFKISITL